METISLRIENLEKRQDEQDSINKEIFVKLDTKVSAEVFFWIIGILVTISLGVSGFLSWQISQSNTELSAQISKVQSDASVTKNSVSYIEGVFKNYDLKVNN